MSTAATSSISPAAMASAQLSSRSAARSRACSCRALATRGEAASPSTPASTRRRRAAFSPSRPAPLLADRQITSSSATYAQPRRRRSAISASLSRSHLLIKSRARSPASRSSLSSSGVMPRTPSVTTSTSWADPALSRLRSIPSCSASSACPSSRRPAVSARIRGTPSRSTLSSSTSRVVPGRLVTMARSSASRAFSRLDLPAFTRPTRAARTPSFTTRLRPAPERTSFLIRSASRTRAFRVCSGSAASASSGKSTPTMTAP